MAAESVFRCRLDTTVNTCLKCRSEAEQQHHCVAEKNWVNENCWRLWYCASDAWQIVARACVMSLLRQIEEKGDGGCDVLQKVDSRCHPSGWAQRTHHMRLLIVECCSQDELEDEILRCIAKKMSLMEFELFACIFFYKHWHWGAVECYWAPCHRFCASCTRFFGTFLNNSWYPMHGHPRSPMPLCLRY